MTRVAVPVVCGAALLGSIATGTASATRGVPNIQQGARGPGVECVQFALRLDGSRITLDGIFGPATKQAVQGEQAAVGLAVDGIVGPQTGTVLVNVIFRHGGGGPNGISDCIPLLPTSN
jgi:peptidoglycan hydrolase-like protein with peptidoglycan-binding domain